MFGEANNLECEVGWFTNSDSVLFFVRVPGESSPTDEEKPVLLPAPKNTRSHTAGSSSASGERRTRFKADSKSPTADSEPRQRQRSGVILSPPYNFNDPKLLSAIIGLSFITLDRCKWESAGVSIRDLLCPEAETLQIHYNARPGYQVCLKFSSLNTL